MNIYENYDGNDINDATFMIESFVEELQLREKLSPKLKALAAAGLIGLSSLGAASCSMPNDPTAYETPAEEETKTPADDETSDDTGTDDIDDDFGFDDTDDTGADDDDIDDNTGTGGDDLNPSDTDPDAGDEGGAGSDTDLTADWPEPKFVFDTIRRTGDDDDTDLLIYLGTIKYIKDFEFCEETMTGEGWAARYRGTAFILTPKIVETIDEITGAPKYEILIDDNNVKIEDVDGLKADVIYFNELSKDNNFNCRYYILYNELFKNCNNAGIKITSDVSKACEAFENAAAKAGIFRTQD